MPKMRLANRNVSMYEPEWEIVKRYARILQPNKPNVSAALRIIVREWQLAEGRKLAEMGARDSEQALAVLAQPTEVTNG